MSGTLTTPDALESSVRKQQPRRSVKQHIGWMIMKFDIWMKVGRWINRIKITWSLNHFICFGCYLIIFKFVYLNKAGDYYDRLS